MAHPARTDSAARLAASVGAGLTLDPDPAGAPSAHRTSLAAWSYPAKASHRCVIQDDALLCQDFAAAVKRVAQDRPRSVVALYYGSAHPGGWYYDRACTRGERYAPLPLDHFIPTVCLLMPMPFVEGYVTWARLNLPADYPWDDEALRQWRQAHPEVDAVATIPSLAQHANESPSIMGHAHHGHRQARCWIGDYDPLLVWP